MLSISHIQHKRSNELVSGNPLPPPPANIEFGEIAVNYAASAETIFIKNDQGEVVPFSSTRSIDDKIGDISDYWGNVAESSITYADVVSMLNNNLTKIMAYVNENFERKPVTIWETDGTTGLLGVNDSSMNLNSWQLENLDFTPYKYVIAYFKQADRDLSTLQSNYCTPSMMICIPLDSASLSTGYTAYLGGANSTNPNDRNVELCILCAIDSTKTKFKVLSEHSLYGTTLGGRNDNGRYCYKLEGHY